MKPGNGANIIFPEKKQAYILLLIHYGCFIRILYTGKTNNAVALTENEPFTVQEK